MGKELPTLEFEGPLGHFWHLKEVPDQAIFKGMVELVTEMKRRKVDEDALWKLVKAEIQGVR